MTQRDFNRAVAQATGESIRTINNMGFPQVESHIPKADAITTHCRLSAADAEFLAATLPRLPCDDDRTSLSLLILTGAWPLGRSRPGSARRPNAFSEQFHLVGRAAKAEYRSPLPWPAR